MCTEIGRVCSFTTAPWSDLFAGLGEGRFDIVFSGLSRATVTAAGFATSQPYFAAEPRFLALQDKTAAIALDTGTAVVGVLAGTPHAAYLEMNINDPARVRHFPDEEELYLTLLGGGVDAIFADGLALYEELIQHPANLAVVFTGPTVDNTVYFDPAIVFALAQGNPLSAEINRALVALADNDTLGRIIEIHLAGYAVGSPSGP